MVLFSGTMQARDNPGQSVIRGIVRDDSTGQVLPWVHIYNESHRTGRIGNEEGRFFMEVNVGDTLVISAVGYMARVYIISDRSLEDEIEIHLRPRLYEIEAVHIRGFRDYADFRRQFLALELPKTRTRALQENLIALSQIDIAQALEQKKVQDALSPEPGKPMVGGLSVPILYKSDLQWINYQRVLEQERKQRVIDKKYNREIIQKITHLSQDEITDFMGFCHFDTEYLYQATEYEIAVMIEKKFKEYLDHKSRGELFYDEVHDWFLFT